MLEVFLEQNGKRISFEQWADDAISELLLNHVREIQGKLSGLRDPETGKHPKITLRRTDADNYYVEIEGSEAVVRKANQLLGIDQSDTITDNLMEESMQPKAFICHASEDKQLAEKIARAFHKNGIDTFYAPWEISDGDGLVEKINEGLSEYTHFLMLVTPKSLPKPWVQAEMDVGVIRKIEDGCKMIIVRQGVEPNELPSLLRTQFARSIDRQNVDESIRELANSILGISKKPPVEHRPELFIDAEASGSGLSAGAYSLAGYLIGKSEFGQSGDPSCEPQELIDALKLTPDEIIDAIDELKASGLVRTRTALNSGLMGVNPVSTTSSLFSELDSFFGATAPKTDALRVAAYLVNEKESVNTKVLAEEFDWPVRRMNPALSYLIDRDLVMYSEANEYPWKTRAIYKTKETRRFVQSEE